MTSLRVDRQEAEEIYKSDCEIDDDKAQDFDLKGVQLIQARAYSNQGVKKKKEETAKTPMVLNLPQKEKKTDDEKINFVSMLADFLKDKVQNMKIVNPSQKISFKMGTDDFSLTLTRHGKKKKKGE